VSIWVLLTKQVLGSFVKSPSGSDSGADTFTSPTDTDEIAEAMLGAFRGRRAALEPAQDEAELFSASGLYPRFDRRNCLTTLALGCITPNDKQSEENCRHPTSSL
jgi:hypothetical protein